MFCGLVVVTSYPIYRNANRPREAWIENLDSDAGKSQVGLIHLHPEIFAVYPRLDIIHENVVWQQKYRSVVCKVLVVLKFRQYCTLKLFGLPVIVPKLSEI